MLELIVISVVSIASYFLVFYFLISLFLKEKKYLFTQNLTIIAIISIIIALFRSIFLVYPIIPFFEMYLLKSIYYIIYKFFPIILNPFEEKSISVIALIVVNIASTLLFVYHAITLFLMLKEKTINHFIIILVSSFTAYLTSVFSGLVTYKLFQIILDKI